MLIWSTLAQLQDESRALYKSPQFIQNDPPGNTVNQSYLHTVHVCPLILPLLIFSLPLSGLCVEY